MPFWHPLTAPSRVTSHHQFTCGVVYSVTDPGYSLRPCYYSTYCGQLPRFQGACMCVCVCVCVCMQSDHCTCVRATCVRLHIPTLQSCHLSSPECSYQLDASPSPQVALLEATTKQKDLCIKIVSMAPLQLHTYQYCPLCAACTVE